MLKRLKQIGPGAMIAAAFIGPGTVTTATIAGAGYGYTLLWAVLFSVLATLILQEMSARLGVVAGIGVGQALRIKLKTGPARILASVLVISAILIGNAAYEAGNISGAALGFDRYDLSLPGIPVNPLILLIGIIAFLLLFSGKYKLIERTLVWLVALMGLIFLSSAIFLKPDLLQVARGLFMPALPEESLIMVIGLIGTTVVPYNLFLHASSVRQRWHGEKYLPASRWDTVLSVLIGGIVTMAILTTAAAAFEGESVAVNSSAALSAQLEPMLGEAASVVIALGFLAAGLSSSVTAPLAAAFATSEVLGWEQTGLRGKRFRMIWGGVLVTGLLFSSLGFRPTAVILFAQVANGLLLPVIAAFLVWVMNDRQIVGRHVNRRWTNVAGVIVIAITVVLGIKGILAGLQAF